MLKKKIGDVKFTKTTYSFSSKHSNVFWRFNLSAFTFPIFLIQSLYSKLFISFSNIIKFTEAYPLTIERKKENECNREREL